MKYPFIQQHSQEDCGAACLASVAKHYGLSLSMRRIREFLGTVSDGTTLWGLQQGATKLGFNSRPVKASMDILDRLNEVPLPAIIHWQGNHWVVLYGKQGKRYIVVDPGVGVRRLSAQELAAGWLDWVMLLFEVDQSRFSTELNESVEGFGRFLKQAWTYRQLLLQAILLNVVVGLLSLASPMLLQVLTDDVLIRGDLQLLNTIAIAVMAMILVSSSLEYIQSNLITHFAQRLELSFILEFCQKILHLPLSYYEVRRSGEVVSRLQDIQQINYLISQVVVNLPNQTFVALISLGLMLFYNWKLSLFSLITAILMGIAVVVFQPLLQRKTQNVLVTDAENQGLLVETFKGASTFKAIGATPQLWEELLHRFSRLANLNLATNQISILNNSFASLVAGIGGIGLLWFGGNLVMSPSESLSAGQLLAFKALNDNFLHLINTVISFADEFTRVNAAAQRLTEVTDAVTEDYADTQKPRVTIAPHAEIVCSNVNFDYPGRAELLENFSAKIPGGKVTALIGHSGCGKSTVAKLIAGLHLPNAGNIRIGGYNQADLTVENLRQQVVLVLQEPHFWNRSIIENLRLGAPDATFEQMVAACQVVGIDEFISQLPNKYQTILGEYATNLSGGQRQRLAIARALLHNPAVLILDESTSALDPASEAELMTRLLHYRQGKTTLLISHRPTVIQRADWLVLLEQGQLKLQGNYADVLAKVNHQLESLYTTPADRLSQRQSLAR